MNPAWPGQRMPYLSLLKVPVGSKVVSVILSEAMEAAPVHYSDDCDQLCPEFLGQPCAHCDAGREVRWKWYAIGLALPSSRMCIVRLTDTALQYSPKLQQLAGACRGLAIEQSRKKGGNGPMIVRLLHEAWPAGQLLPVAPALHPQVCRILGADPTADWQRGADPTPLATDADADDLIPYPPGWSSFGTEAGEEADDARGLGQDSKLSGAEARAALAKARQQRNGQAHSE